MSIKLPEMLICEHCGSYYFNEISVYVKRWSSSTEYEQLRSYLKCEVCNAIYDKENGEEITLFDKKD